MRGTLLSCCFILLAVILPVWTAPQGFGRKKGVIPAIKEDIPFIECQFCQITASHLHSTVADLRAQLPSWKKLSEEKILEAVENACAVDKEEGEWITTLDVVEEGKSLVVKEMQKVGSGKPRASAGVLRQQE
jgi:hypothetical protein